jgi:hypothetical protein
MSQIRWKRYICPHIMYPWFSSYFNETWIFSTDFSLKNTLLKYRIPW